MLPAACGDDAVNFGSGHANRCIPASTITIGFRSAPPALLSKPRPQIERNVILRHLDGGLSEPKGYAFASRFAAIASFSEKNRTPPPHRHRPGHVASPQPISVRLDHGHTSTPVWRVSPPRAFLLELTCTRTALFIFTEYAAAGCVQRSFRRNYLWPDLASIRKLKNKSIEGKSCPPASLIQNEVHLWPLTAGNTAAIRSAARPASNIACGNRRHARRSSAYGVNFHDNDLVPSTLPRATTSAPSKA
jgi:hypothetical protein